MHATLQLEERSCRLFSIVCIYEASVVTDDKRGEEKRREEKQHNTYFLLACFYVYYSQASAVDLTSYL